MDEGRPTTRSLARDLFEEWQGEGEGHDLSVFIDERATDIVPPMTTVLFQMVVDDNSLAFLDAPMMSTEPFAVLSAAIRAEVERLALELIEAEIEQEAEGQD